MKFKLVESIYDRLVETKTHLNKVTKNALLAEIRCLQTDGKVKRETSNNKSLKLYLCAKYKIDPTSDIAVHHINLDYNDYRPENIALVSSSAHSAKHREALGDAINNALHLRNMSSKDIHKLDITDLTKDEIITIYTKYFDTMQEWLATNNYIT